MLETSIIYPMAALFLLTIVVLLLILYFRVKAVRSRKISPRYFKLNKGGELPEHLILITQNYNNLLELPVLFYAVCLIILVLKPDNISFVVLAWIYVILRYIHSYIHTTYNHIIHRLIPFALSCFVLTAMWVKVIITIS